LKVEREKKIASNSCLESKRERKFKFIFSKINTTRKEENYLEAAAKKGGQEKVRSAREKESPPPCRLERRED